MGIYSLNSGVDSDKNRNKDDKYFVDDSTFTFRVNLELKQDFLKICKLEQYSAAASLKRYMLRCVRNGYISHDFRTVGEDKGFDKDFGKF